MTDGKEGEKERQYQLEMETASAKTKTIQITPSLVTFIIPWWKLDP